MRAANTKIQRRQRLPAGFVRGGSTTVLALAVCLLPSISLAQPPAAGGALVRDLQNDLAALASLARATNGADVSKATPQARQLLERVRASDLLLQEQQRSIALRLQQTTASGALLQRQLDHARLFRERLDRLYQAAEQITSGTPASDAQTRAAFAAIVEALRDAIDTESRAPIGAMLPYRSLAWPQVAPQPAPAITPAYLTTPVQAPQAADLAETPDTRFTGAVRAQASALSQDAIAIFEFVQNSVRTEFYFGAMKDAADTLRQSSGNDTDQASLLIALLRASQVPARYVRGVIRLSGPQAMAWTAAGSARRAAEIFTRAGIPFRPILQGGTIGAFEIEHTWVEAYVPYSNYRGVRLGTIGRAWIPLDPSFKAVDTAADEDVLAAMGFNATAIVANYLSQSQPLAPMEFYRQAIVDYLAQTGSPLTFDDVLSTRTTRASATGLLPSTLPYSVVLVHAESPALPDVLRHRVRFIAEGEGGLSFDVTMSAAELAGRRLTLSYVPATVDDHAVAHSFLGLDNTPAYLVKLRPVLKVGGVVRAAGATPVQMGGFHSFTVEIHTPRGMVPVVNSMLAGGYYAVGLAAQPGAYEIPLARPPDDTEHPAADRLYAIAIDYLRRWNDAELTLERLLRVRNVRPALSHVIVGTVHARTVVFGQPQEITWRGVFVDADLRVAEPVPTGADDTRAPAFMRLSGLAGSVLEADVLRSNLNVDAVSAASVIQLARESAIVVEDVTAGTLAEVLARLQTADIVKTEIADAVNQGWRATIPQREVTRNIWTGTGYTLIDPASGAGGYFLSGGLAGGSTTQPPEDWPDQPLADELAGPNAEPPNTDPASVRFLTKIAITDKQKGVVGEVLERELAIWARDEDGRPVEGATVTFLVQAGGGSFSNGAATIDAVTDRNGIARAALRLGTRTGDLPFYVRVHPADAHTAQVGQNIVTATAVGGEGEIGLLAPFQQFAYPGPAHHITKVVGDQNQGAPGQSGGTLLARLEDQYDNPIANGELLFNVLPPESSQPGTLPPATVNMVIYRQQPPCAVQVPTISDCSGTNQISQTTSASGAAVETILGNTESTIYRVRVDVAGDLSIAPQTFTLSSLGERTFGTGSYAPPMLAMSVVHLLNDRGELINSGPVGTLLDRPFEARVFMLEDDYTLVETGDPCTDTPDDPPCWRVQSLETKRLRLIGRNIPGTVSFPRGAGNPDVTAPRQNEAANVVFTPFAGGGTMTSTETPGIGRYAARLFLGPQPALNLVDADVTASVWVPCFDVHSGQFPVVARLASGVRGDQILLNQFQCARSYNPGQETPPPLFQLGQDSFSIYRQAAFGVRATVTPAAVHVTPDGIVTGTTNIPYLIEPGDPTPYDAADAEVDLFVTETNGLDTWLGYLPGSATHGSGVAQLLQGTQLETEKPTRAQLVLNRGSSVEMRSEKVALRVVRPAELSFDSAQAIPVSTIMDRANQNVCPSPGAIVFGLSRAATVSITVDGFPFSTTDANGTVTWTDVALEGGVHTLSVLPAAVPLPGTHPLVITARFTSPDQPDIVETANGVILHNVSTNAFLPVGHTLVEGVDLFDGHFTLARDDLSIPGVGPALQFTRSYSTSGHNAAGTMGAGWSHNWDARVVEACGVVTLIGSQGSGIRFDSPVAGTDADGNPIATYRPQAGYHGRLVRHLTSGDYDFYTVQGDRFHYQATAEVSDGRATRLAFVEDTNRNRLTLTYQATPPFNLAEITDAAGRKLTLTYGQFGFAHRLIGLTGPLNLTVSYEYDIYGNLVRATRGPRTERYQYATDNPRDLHNLVRIIGPNNGATGGDVLELEYFGVSDSIPGESSNVLLFPEKYEIVKSVTAAPGSPVAARHTFTYDHSNRATRLLTTVLDPRSVSTMYTMDPHFGAVVEQRTLTASGPNVRSTRWAFQDGVNDVLMTRVTDPLGRETSYTYDVNGNPATVTIHTGTSGYAPVTNASGVAVPDVVTRTDFHPTLGRLVRQVDPEGRTVDHELEAGTGNVLSTTVYPGGTEPPATKRFTYESRGGLNGLLTSETDPRGKVTRFTEFDAFGNATTVIGPEGTITTNTYDARNRLTATSDTTGRRMEYEYDELDRAVRVTRSTWAPPTDLRTTITTFLPGGQSLTVTDGNGHTTELVYDQRNRTIGERIVVVDAAGQSATLTRSATLDGNGNKIAEIDRRGLRHAFEYDELNRVVRVVVENQVLATYDYDGAGNRIGETDLHGHTTQQVLDSLYRPIRTVLPLAPYFTARTYDLSNNVLSESDANGRTTTMTYDGAGRLSSTTNPVGVTKQFTSDASGNRVLERNLATGLQIASAFDGLNRPLTVRRTFVDPITGAGVSYDTTFDYNDVEHVTTTVSARGVVTRARHNGHDQVIERIEDPDGLNLRTSYTYDANGNLITESDNEGAAIDRTIEYDSLNRPIRVTRPLGGQELTFYDGNDNVIRTVNGRGVITRSEYDHFDRKLRDILVESLSNDGHELVTSEFVFDDAANSFTSRDANGQVTRQELDALHRVTRIVDPLGHEERTVWDGINARARINKRGIRTDLAYDNLNRLVEQRRVFEGGIHLQTSQYSEAQNRRIDTDANGVETVTQLDALQRVRRVSRRHPSLAAAYGTAEITVEQHDYDAHDNVTRSVDGNGHVTTFEYDNGDRRVAVTAGFGSPAAATTTYAFDRANNLLRVKDGRAHGRPFDVRYTYDLRNRKVLEENGAGEVKAFAYDQADNLVRVTEAKGQQHRTEYVYDELNQLMAVDETRGGAGGVTRYLYDANRNRLAHQDASGALITWRYDGLNRPTGSFVHSVPGALAAGTSREQGAGGNEATARRVQFAFDPVGNQTLIVDAAGQRVAKTYDALDRITSKVFSNHQNAADGSPVLPRILAIAYAYDDAGNQVRVDETKQFAGGQAIETATMDYDALNRVTRRTNHDGKIVRFEYDRTGNQSAVIDADGVRTSYLFDARNQIVSATVEGATTQYEYWPDGLQRTIVHPNGVVAEMDYDAADRPRHVVNHSGDPATPLSRFDYGYDANGNRISTVERHARLHGGAAQHTTYEYDALNRLTRVDYPGAAELQYVYAANGNRIGESGVSPEDGAAVDRTYAYDHLNQLTAIVDAADAMASEALRYDENGNTVERRVGMLNENGEVTAPLSTTSYEWDIRDFLARTGTGASAMTFDYDYAGRRVKSIGSLSHVRYLYDRRDVVQEYDGGSFLTTLRYSYGPGGIFSLATAGPAAARLYFVADALGSTSELIDGAGVAQASYSYDAWGRSLQSFDLTPNRRKFTGHYQDSETGLQYFGARYYDGSLGRFLTRDSRPGEPAEPISQNPFLYAHANPLMFRDLDGHEAASCNPNVFLSCTRRKLIDIGTVAKERAKENVAALGRGLIYEPLATMYDLERSVYGMAKMAVTGEVYEMECTSAICHAAVQQRVTEKDPWKSANDLVGMQARGFVEGKFDPLIKGGAVIAAVASGDGTRITESIVDLGFSIGTEFAMKKLTRELMPTATGNGKFRRAMLEVNQEMGVISMVRDASPMTGFGGQMMGSLIPGWIQPKPLGIKAKSFLFGVGFGKNKETGRFELFRTDNDMLSIWDPKAQNKDGSFGRFLSDQEVAKNYIPKLDQKLLNRGMNTEVQHPTQLSASQGVGGPLSWSDYGKIGHPGPVTVFGRNGQTYKLSSSEVRNFAILNGRPWHPDWDATPAWLPDRSNLRHARTWGAMLNVDDDDKRKRLYAK